MTFAPEVPVGPDGKLLSHALRVLQQAHEMQVSHTITLPRPNRMVLLAIKQGQTPAQNTLNDIRAARATLLSLTGEHPLAPPADDSFGLNCVKELYDQHLMVARWQVQTPMFARIRAPVTMSRQAQALDLCDGG